ncbi:acyl-CoA thioesterase [Nocardia callitridis]|uniref:Thioesterase family protein n=1 Tax=Nocardia callitridis TaxID=648753 RepID=A0ABP9KMU9_9NOCA
MRPRPWTQAELSRLMDVRPCGQGRYLAPAHGSSERNVVEAGQLLADAVVAAAKEVPTQRVVSASMIFSRVVAHDAPLLVQLEVLRTGRTFSTVQAHIHQRGVLCCAGVVLLDAGAPDLISATAPMPAVDPPDRLRSLAIPGAVVAGRDMRVVDDAGNLDADTVGPPEINVWTRFQDAPDADYLHAALLTHSVAHWTVDAALRPHAGFGVGMAHSRISTGITMVTVTFHEEADVTDWLLYATRATYAGRGHAQSEGQVFTIDGRMVASYGVHAMVREFRAPDAAGRIAGDTLL